MISFMIYCFYYTSDTATITKASIEPLNPNIIIAYHAEGCVSAEPITCYRKLCSVFLGFVILVIIWYMFRRLVLTVFACIVGLFNLSTEQINTIIIDCMD